MKNTTTNALHYMKLKTDTRQDLDILRANRKILPNITQRRTLLAKN